MLYYPCDVDVLAINPSTRQYTTMRTRADILTEVTLPSGTVLVDEHGYLTDPNLWTTEFAHYTAEKEGVTLSDRHFDVISFIRNLQEENGVTPDQRFLLKYLAKYGATTKSEAKDILYGLFPQGYVKHACKIAGMRQPRAWSTG